MFRKQLNYACLELCIEPRGPVLIKSGLESSDPTRPGMEFVRTRHPSLGETVYLPGTSLKGAVRHHAERCLRGLDLQVCNPLQASAENGEQQPCHLAGDSKMTDETAASFRGQCWMCRTFGSLKVAGRCSIQDAYPWSRDADRATKESGAEEANSTELRFQVGIDRKTGGTKRGALFDLELVVAGSFYSEIRLRNFQLWQLGLIQALVDDLDSGVIPIGFGKSRGLGQVRARITAFKMEMADTSEALRGVAALCSSEELRAYDLIAGDTLELPNIAKEAMTRTWRGTHLSLAEKPARDVLRQVRDVHLSDLISVAAKRKASSS